MSITNFDERKVFSFTFKIVYDDACHHICFANFVDAVVIADNNEMPRSTAEATSTGPIQSINPLTKEQLQQAFIYLLQVLHL